MGRSSALLLLLGSCADSFPPRARLGRRREEPRARGLPVAQATLPAVDRMSIRVPGAAQERIRKVGWAILGQGWMTLSEAADGPTQAAYNQARIVPPGYREAENVEAARRPGPPWDGDRRLLRAEPVLRTGMITEAWTEGNDVSFRVEKGHRDAGRAATRRVLLVVLRAERVGWIRPGVRGDGLLPTSAPDAASRLALDLRLQPLRVKLGRGHSCMVREAESLRYYGVPPSTPAPPLGSRLRAPGSTSFRPGSG